MKPRLYLLFLIIPLALLIGAWLGRRPGPNLPSATPAIYIQHARSPVITPIVYHRRHRRRYRSRYYYRKRSFRRSAAIVGGSAVGGAAIGALAGGGKGAAIGALAGGAGGYIYDRATRRKRVRRR